jgi:predicted enzyme related to lactoylglutathione lyase
MPTGKHFEIATGKIKRAQEFYKNFFGYNYKECLILSFQNWINGYLKQRMIKAIMD